jgi:hypothetical protein
VDEKSKAAVGAEVSSGFGNDSEEIFKLGIEGETSDYSDIYDRIFKRLLSSSDKFVVMLINGIFGRNHPVDSKVELHEKEFVRKDNSKIIADAIASIGDVADYHFEFQTSNDNHMVIRMFEYDYAWSSGRLIEIEDRYVMKFPASVVISLFDMNVKNLLTLEFSDGTKFDYKMNVFNLDEHDLDELIERSLFLLVPFYCLKFKNEKIDGGNVNDLIALIRKTVVAVNAMLAPDDVPMSVVETIKLAFRDLILHAYDVEELEEVKEMFTTDIRLPSEIMIEKQKAEVEKQKVEVEKQKAEVEKKKVEVEKKKAEVEKEKIEVEKEKVEFEKEKVKLRRMWVEMERKLAEAEGRREDLQSNDAKFLGQKVNEIEKDWVTEPKRMTAFSPREEKK